MQGFAGVTFKHLVLALELQKNSQLLVHYDFISSQRKKKIKGIEYNLLGYSSSRHKTVFLRPYIT